MSFPRYPAYKPSGVEWLGEVPEHWEMGQSRRRFRLRNEPTKEADEQLTASQKHGIIRQAEFIESEGRRVVEVIKGQDILKHVEPGDFVISMRSFQGGLEYSEVRGCISSAYVMLAPVKQVIPTFFSWLFKSQPYIQALQSTTNLVRDGQALRFSNFCQVDIPVIPPNEQLAIATFLDHETAKIDALIAEQQRLIELLQEKRQAVISHVVTKGLNPDATMKDSGVEWLGEVPEHWGLTRLKNATDLIVDCPHETPAYAEDGEFLVVRTADLDGGRLRDESDMKRVDVLEYTNRIRRASLEEHDIVYGREGERWGHAALVPLSSKFCLGQRMMQFRCGPNWEPEFLMWLLNSRAVYLQGALDTVGATSPHVNVATIRNYILPAPPRQEQAFIAGYLANAAAKHDLLIDESKVSSSVLQERRSALISAAVTGQIDVRGLVPEAEAA
jgi:type I restriction enzyme S subunit